MSKGWLTMAVSRGKQFEQVVREAFEKVPDVSIDRLHDQTTGFRGSQNICDFIVYKEPYEYYFECKSVHGNTLPFSNITETQWKGLLEKSKIDGVFAGVICWWVDRDITKFIPIHLLDMIKVNGGKSIRYDFTLFDRDLCTEIRGKKKRVFFEYDMEEFLNAVSMS